MALLCAVLLAACAAAQSSAGRYAPVSRTGISITGELAIAGSRMTFADGQSIGLSVEAAAGERTLYRVRPPANPILLHGNRLCGPNRVTYVAVAPDRRQGLYQIRFYETAAPPAAGESACMLSYYRRLPE